MPADLLTDATRFIPPAVAALAARTTLSVLAGARAPVNLVISNVPGSRVPLYCAGAPLEAHSPVSVIADGIGLNSTAMSYLDGLDFGLVGDRQAIPDLWSTIAGLRAELEALGAPAASPRFAKDRAPRPRAAPPRPPGASRRGSPRAGRS